MSATAIIAIIVRAAELIHALAGVSELLLGKTAGRAAELAGLIVKLNALIESARSVLSEHDIAALEAELAIVHPRILALSAELDAALAVAAAD